LKIKTSFTFREECTQKVFKKSVLWRKFGCTKEEVTGWEKFRKEELHDFNYSPDVGIIKKIDVIIASGVRVGENKCL
jgi:hypothetical protein